MTTTNTKQNLITALAILMALATSLYALYMHNMTIEKYAATETPQFQEGEDNPVVLILNGQKITRAAILDNFSKSESQLPQGTNLAQIFPMMQQQYIISTLLTEKGYKHGLGKTDPKIAMRMLDAKKQGVRAAVIEKLGKEAISDADIKQTYDDVVGNAPDVTERQARHILVADEGKAGMILSQAQSGKDFAQLATEKSEGPSAENGGDLGYFTQDQMVAEFATAAFNGEIGKVYPQVVQTQFGFHIIKVEDERQRPKPTLEQATPQIEAQLRQVAVSEKINDIVENADITLFDMNGVMIEDEQSEETDADASNNGDAVDEKEEMTEQ